MNDQKSLTQFLKFTKKEKVLDFFCDFETFQYNQEEGRKKPSQYRNEIFSFAVAFWISDTELDFLNFVDTSEFFNLLALNRETLKKKRVRLHFHNGNKYDNHFLRHDLLFYNPKIKIYNEFLRQAIENSNTEKDAFLKINDFCILEKRVKSKNNLDLIFKLNGILYETVDSLFKTRLKLDTLGKMLNQAGVLDKKFLKTDFDYLKYNLDKNLKPYEAKAYAENIFKNLDTSQKTYILNDVIILAHVFKYYSVIFPNFDYEKITISKNILDSYLVSDLSEFQLLHKVSDEHIKYTDYHLGAQNFYDFLKLFYKGGLNFYNDQLIGQTLSGLFSIDKNSSYPEQMYYQKIPTFIKKIEAFDDPTEVKIITSDPDYFQLYEISKKEFNLILSGLKAKQLIKMFIKYYSNNFENLYINSKTIELLNHFLDVPLKTLKLFKIVTFDCIYFDARDKIFEYYKIKTQGKLKNKIIMRTPQDYTITDKINTVVFSPEEVGGSKVKLNGLYGLPALRSHFNLFRFDETGNYQNIINGYENTERNLVYSIFVTACAFESLIEPMKDFEDIDKNFVYSDTDSLYIRTEEFKNLDPSYLDPIALGKWDIEHEGIEKFYVLNHKKYAFEEKGKINVRSGGVALNSFDLSVPFDEFIDTQFSQGATIYNRKSILNTDLTISIYDSATNLEQGGLYPIFATDYSAQIKKEIIAQLKEDEEVSDYDDLIYIETPFGAISQREIFQTDTVNPFTEDVQRLIDLEQDVKKYFRI